MTLFNFLNFAIAVCLLFVGAYSNLAFLAIIIVNMSIGIFQEIHARNLVQKLSIVAKEMFMLFEMAYNKKLIQKN